MSGGIFLGPTCSREQNIADTDEKVDGSIDQLMDVQLPVGCLSRHPQHLHHLTQILSPGHPVAQYPPLMIETMSPVITIAILQVTIRLLQYLFA